MNIYDQVNVETYKKGDDKIYLCNMCGQGITLSDSVSHRGYNLICNRCLYKMQRITGICNLLGYIQNVGLNIQKEQGDEDE